DAVEGARDGGPGEGDARAMLAAELEDALAEPGRNELERVVRRVLDPRPLDERIEVRDLDELGTAPVGGGRDRTRALLLADVRADARDLARLHIRAEAHGELRQPLEAPLHARDSTFRDRV